VVDSRFAVRRAAVAEADSSVETAGSSYVVDAAYADDTPASIAWHEVEGQLAGRGEVDSDMRCWEGAKQLGTAKSAVAGRHVLPAVVAPP
jgi:hypothetical protein